MTTAQFHWGYDSFSAECQVNFTGPLDWGKKYPYALYGKKQSPIDIDTSTTRIDLNLPNLLLSYDPSKCVTITNNGHSFAVSAQESGTNLTGGPLRHNYRLAQFHCHWGSCDEKGAEHTVDGHRYPAELHLVHWNTSLYASFADAVRNPNGIAVLGVFLKTGREHPAWAELEPHFKEIRYMGDSVKLRKGFNPGRLFPENKQDYWTYDGSLTTPPCYESVRFILFHEPVEISTEQLKEFRSLSYLPASAHKRRSTCRLVDNFRPCMPLNNREVVTTWLDNFNFDLF
ncbi:carbonic anhydrase 2-like [Amphiura filiformis]|uniref:carbonic anhydrase 2-like n=1 Tax=Amphiura filiformis TaxID=82378 RepID=UPI003B21B2B4